MGLAGKSGGGGQLCKQYLGLPGKSGNSPGSGSSLKSVRHGLKMRFRQRFLRGFHSFGRDLSISQNNIQNEQQNFAEWRPRGTVKSKNGRKFSELNQAARGARYNARGAKRRAREVLVSLQ